MLMNGTRVVLLGVIFCLVNSGQAKKRGSVENPHVRCVNLNFVNNYNKPFKVWKQITNTKFKGFIVTGRNYKLKTIVSEEHSDSPVRYHAIPLDETDDVKLHISGQSTISVMPFDCDDSFVELVVSPNSASPSTRTLERTDFDDSPKPCTQAVGGSLVGHNCCHFPFTYQGKMYTKCSNEDSPSMLWCATTSSFDRDGKWGYCVMTS